jgi:poly(A) polymerase
VDGAGSGSGAARPVWHARAVSQQKVSDQAGGAAVQAAVEDARRRAVAELARLAPVVTELGAVFADAGHELALVGGPVRDALLGRLGDGVFDLDFATDARPDQTEALLAAWADTHWDIGRAFGTIGARKGDHVVEVTTYRTEVYDPSSRKPEVAYGDTLEGDLSRRDFTVNAMALRLPGLVFVDPFDGITDLAHSLLRTPKSAEQSFDDDPLRMMRAARFASQLRARVAPEVVTAMRTMAERISIVSAERVRTELEKLVVGADPRRGLELMVDTGLADQVLPELPKLKLEIDEHHRHKDVYEHTLTVLDQAIALEDGPDGPVPGPDFVLRFAALMHDVGKPPTRRFEPGGGVSFHHHEVVGAKMVRKRMRALKYSKQMVDDVSQLVFLHLRFHGYGKGQWTDSAVRRYVTDAGPLLPRLHKLVRADCTTRNKRRAAALQATYDDIEERIARLAEQEDLARVRPDLDGNAIMELLGIPAGPDVGKAWKYLKELRLDRGPLSRDEAEAELLSWWATQQG